MKILLSSIFVYIILLLGPDAFSQQMKMPLVSGSFKDVSVSELANRLEEKTGHRFFYDAAQTDSISISIEAVDEPLDSLLKRAFTQTDLHYAIDPSGNIFITVGRAIVTSLPFGFNPRDSTGKSQTENPEESLANLDRQEKNKIPVASLETRLYEIGHRSGNTDGRADLAGYVRDDKSGEPLVGVSIFAEKAGAGTSTDQFGYYSLSLPKGRHTLTIQSLGKKDTRRQIMLYSDGKLDIELHDQILSLKEVIISAAKTKNIRETQLGVQRLNIKTIKQVPTVFGESDIMRVVLTLPGVKSAGEASTGFNVRGGAADQNLILFNDATIYNPSHFFGFFSTFNPDVVKDVELYKSSIPVKYGGRLSSVLEVTSKEGNKRNFTGSAGLGPVTSRFSIEGPLIKDRTSFVLGARTTYANWLLGILPQAYRHSRASFYDVSLNLTHQADKKNKLFFTGYISGDHFSLNSDTTYGYSNKNISLKWKHEFNNKLYSLITAGFDKYEYKISSDKRPLDAYELAFDINQSHFSFDMNYYPASKHAMNFGISSILYKLHPGTFRPTGDSSLVGADIIPAEQALESAIYLGDKFTVTSDLALDFGIRYSLYNYLGPQKIAYYAPGLPKNEGTQIDSVDFGRGDFIQNYGGPEFRFAARYSLGSDLSVKLGYNSQRQFIHMLSNTTAIAPTDIWKLSDPNIRPQYGDQVSFGIYKNLKSNTIETSMEVYYKRIKDYLDYKSGASLVLNHLIERDVINTKGKAYGLELMIRKLTGKLNGWVSYTWSRTLLRVDSTSGERINQGKFYPSSYDKPHDVTLVGNYRLSHRFSVSLNATYSTGRPITLPIGRYSYGGSQRALYSDRNAYRIPDYFRTDLSMNIDGNHKVKQKTHNSWTIGVYNLTGRRNAFSVYFVSENGRINGYKLSVFGSAIPFVNFNIRF